MTALLLATAFAAPVPSNERAEQQKLETLWKELEADDPVSRVRAAFALLDHPKAAEFLRGKLPPVTATAGELKGWLKDLNSDDEKVRKAAYEYLQYFPPQLALTPAEQAEIVTTNDGRVLLFALWCHIRLSTDDPDDYSVELTPPRNGERGTAKITFTAWRNGKKQTFSQDGNVSALEFVYATGWNRAELAAHVLHRIDTKESRAALERLASGHEQAKLTRTAAGLSKAKPAAEKESFADRWGELMYRNTPDVFDDICAFIDTSDTAKRLKGELPAIKASKERVTEWLKALDSQDPKVWQPAFESLLYFRPRIALDWQEQIDAVTTAHGRTALFDLWRGRSFAPVNLNVDPGCTLAIEERDGGRRLTLSVPAENGKRQSDSVELKPLNDMFSYHWRRVRLAIVALERIGTDDAKEVLKRLADGHPDLLPTKEAKAALERIKK